MQVATRTCSSLVSCESLKGMCEAPVVSAEMQLPSALRLLLMFFASSNTLPCAPVFEIFSLPAKSTRFNREFFVPPSANFCSRRRINTLHVNVKALPLERAGVWPGLHLWLRLLRAFIAVAALAFALSPSARRAHTSSLSKGIEIVNARQRLLELICSK